MTSVTNSPLFVRSENTPEPIARGKKALPQSAQIDIRSILSQVFEGCELGKEKKQIENIVQIEVQFVEACKSQRMDWTNPNTIKTTAATIQAIAQMIVNAVVRVRKQAGKKGSKDDSHFQEIALQLQQAEEEKESLATSFEELEGEYQALAEEAAAIEEELSAKIEALEVEKQGEHDRFSRAYTKITGESGRLKAENKRLKEETSDLRKKLREQGSQQQRQEEKITLDFELVDTKEKVRWLEGKVEDLASKKDALDLQNVNLECENVSLKARLSAIETVSVDPLKEEVETLTRRNQSIEAEIQELRQKKETKERKLDELKRKKNSLKDGISEKEQEVASLKEQLQESEFMISQLDQENQRLVETSEKRLAKYQKWKEKFHQLLAESEASIHEKTQEIGELTADREDLEEQLRLTEEKLKVSQSDGWEKTFQIVELEETVGDLRLENRQLLADSVALLEEENAELEETKEKLQQAQGEVFRSGIALSRKQFENELLQKQVEELRSQIEERESKISEAVEFGKGRMAYLIQAVEEAADELGTAPDARADREQQVSKLMKDLLGAEVKQRKKDEKIARQKAEIARLKKENAKLRRVNEGNDQLPADRPMEEIERLFVDTPQKTGEERQIGGQVPVIKTPVRIQKDAELRALFVDTPDKLQINKDKK